MSLHLKKLAGPLVLVFVISALFIGSGSSADPSPHITTAPKAYATSVPVVQQDDALAWEALAIAYQTQVAAEAEAERQRIEAERVAAEEAAAAEAQRVEDARIAAERAAATRVIVPSGGCCGPHSDAWWQGVAVCEQGGNNHPYFGYFSFMDGSQGGRPWAEQVAAGNALLARAGREIGPWAASCVAAGYRSSPSG